MSAPRFYGGIEFLSPCDRMWSPDCSGLVHFDVMPLFLPSNFSVFLFFLCALVLFSASKQECHAQIGLAEQGAVMGIGMDMEAGNAANAGRANPGQVERQVQEPQQQIAVPEPNAKKDILKEGWWGPGGYFSLVKLPLYIIVFIVWVGCASWINADQERLRRENREVFNLVYLLLYGVLCTAIFFIPIFWVAFSLTVLICFVPALTYVVIRNQSLPPGDQVLTAEHLWFLFAVAMGKIGVKIQHGQRLSYASGPPVELEPVAKGIDPQTLQARLILARNAPGYNLLRANIHDAIESRATAIRFEFSSEETKIWHQVDGVWLELVPIPRKLGRSKEKDIYEEMQEAVKKLVGGNPDDRRSKQGGKFNVVIGNPKKKSTLKKFDVDYLSQGTPTGEAAMMQLHAKSVSFKTLEEIGVRGEMQQKILTQINRHEGEDVYGRKGIVLVSAPLTHGLRSTITVLSRSCDRFTRDVANIEDVNGISEPIENIIPGMYDSSKKETPVKPLADLLFRGIGVLFVRDMSAPETVKTCCESLQHDERLFITMVRAKDGVETLLRFLAVDFPSQQIVQHINSVICQRLIRVLCSECKEPYEPDPKTLHQLRLSPNQVQQLFRKRTPLPPHEEAKRGICHKCHGVGYFGRTALFEVLTISDEIKALLLSKADPAVVRQQFYKEKQQTFFHEGVRMLLRGETTVDELSRVLKM